MTNIVSLKRPEERVRTRKRKEALSVLQPSLLRIYEEIRAEAGQDYEYYRTPLGDDTEVHFGWLGPELHGKVFQGRTLLFSMVLLPTVEARTWKRGDWESAIVKAGMRRLN